MVMTLHCLGSADDVREMGVSTGVLVYITNGSLNLVMLQVSAVKGFRPSS